MFGIKKLLQKTNKSKMLSPSNTPYMMIGGEQGVKTLANAFYDEMETNPHLQELLEIHSLPLDGVRIKFFQYLSGWMGGPPLFEQQFGHPRLRQRHMHVKVTKKQAELWMLCMNNAMIKTIEDKALKNHLRQAFAQLALHMVNHP